MSNQPCRFCGIELTRFEKLPDGKWKRYDKNGEHRYDVCKSIQNQNNKSKPVQQQQVLSPSGYVAGSSTFPVNEEPKAQGVTIFSLHTIIAELRKEVRELRKQIETTASVQDSIAQKQELLIQKIGYPTPEPVQVMAKVEQSRDFKCQDCGVTFIKGIVNKEKDEYICINCYGKRKTTDESGVQIKDGQEVKPITVQQQRQIHPTNEEELKEVINPMRVQVGWEDLSEAFLCHSCNGKIHNGFINQAGTKLCPDCKTNLDANEAYEKIQREDGLRNNEEDEHHPPLRSIEDVNNDL